LPPAAQASQDDVTHRPRDNGEEKEEDEAQEVPERQVAIDDRLRRVGRIDVALEPRPG
jgi:hypothetical protein